MSRHAARLVAISVFASGGFASALAVSLPARSAAAGSATTTVPPVTSPAAEVLAVSGHGWGHGLGLSQWGAYGYALHGYGFARILAHYYPHTSLGPAPARTLRVLLRRSKRVSLGSTAAWRAVDATGATIRLDPGTFALTPTSKLDGRAVTLPLTFTSPAPIAVGGTPYRGRIVVSADRAALQVVNVVGLEAYLEGVVPAEMPSDWPPAALEAQAVAARSYALARRMRGGSFDLYDDTRSQVYGGIDVESPATSAAVDATRGRVVLFDGAVADTTFFSTSGGRTVSAAELLGTPVPYLVSVADPYDTSSPYHDWGPVLFDARSVAKKLRVGAPIDDVQAVPGPSGRVRTVSVLGPDGAAATFTGAQVRAALDLRSTWFSPTLFSLAPGREAITYGGAASLTGFVRGRVGSVSLEAQPYGRGWGPARTVTTAADGSFRVAVSPDVSTSYRLAAGPVRAGLTAVRVSAGVVATIASSGASGSTRPAAASAPVALQRQDGGAWTTVSSTPAGAGGRFAFGGPLAPGAYRVRFAPGAGVAPGLSSVVTVP